MVCMEKAEEKPPHGAYLSLESTKSMGSPLTFSTEPARVGKTRRTVLRCCGGVVGKELKSCCVQRAVSQRKPQQTNTEENRGRHKGLDEYKTSLSGKLKFVTEGNDASGKQSLLRRIFTELHITEEPSEEVTTLREASTKGRNIFKDSDQEKRIRVVTTNGIAGIGKTFLVQKWTLDWAEGTENPDVSLVILVSFRELNLVRKERHSLLSLLRVLQPTLEEVTAETLAQSEVVFILDGLDESRLSLDFNNAQVVSNVTQESFVNVLVTNLIKGNLLPSALVWITTRPAAAKQIPPQFVDRVTKVQGFDNDQKKEYFRRRFSDEEVFSRIFSHVTSSRSLHVMCQIPVFCWITATVLDHMLTTTHVEKLPTMLTSVFSHFLMDLTKRKKNKYGVRHETSPQELTEADRQVLLKLGRLAFEHLGKENVMLYDEDLEHFDLDITEASVYSGVFTEIIKREPVIFQKKAFCFVHQNIQEFMAAIYVFYSFTNKATKTLERFLGNTNRYCTRNPPLDAFLKKAIIKSLNSTNNPLDLFVCFFRGLSLESNQRLLGGLLGQMEDSSKRTQKAVQNLRGFEYIQHLS